MNAPRAHDVEDRLADALMRSDAMVATAAPILRHLLVSDDQSLFSDALVARVRGGLAHLAQQLMVELGKVAGVADPAEFAGEHRDGLAAQFYVDSAFLTHAHALALEAVLTERLQARAALDPVVSPLVQAMIASADASVAGTAMNLLAAQARFLQQQRRMEMPIGELPGDLLHRALQTMLAYAGPESEELAREAAANLRSEYSEAASRLSLLSRCIGQMGSGAVAALSISHAGMALFLTAISTAAGQDRALSVLAANDTQGVRLGLMLRSAGMKAELIEEQFAWLHPDHPHPEGLDRLRVDQATALLSRTAPLVADDAAHG